jgi:hypothetical protein
MNVLVLLVRFLAHRVYSIVHARVKPMQPGNSRLILCDSVRKNPRGFPRFWSAHQDNGLGLVGGTLEVTLYHGPLTDRGGAA